VHIRDEDDKPTVAPRGDRSTYEDDDGSGYSAVSRVERRESLDETVVQPRGPIVQHVAWLYCQKGLRKGSLHQMRKERTEFGRGRDCDLMIEDEFASTRHGAILLEDGIWRLFDFASTNGTSVNGVKLGDPIGFTIELKDGDVIAIGDSEFVFKKIG